ncbi:hypothetical protein LJC40_00205 [Synergistaceae bacterium OttesenSCG-928-D05]|nr:hypothetical protein [Synergistaceae bacterium OttesenSCG-928-D05]
MKQGAWKFILAGLIGLILGLLLFLPWQAIGDYAIEKGLTRAAEKNIYATVNSHTVEGVFNKVFVLRGIRVDYPVFSITLRELRIDPHMLGLLSASQEVDLVIGRGELIPVTRQSLEWNSGTAKVTRRGEIISFNEVDIKGAFSAKGSLAFSTATGKLTSGALTLTVPVTMDRALQMVSGSGLVPLRKIKDGEWRIER